MCEPKSGGGKVLVGTAVAGGIALAAASVHSTAATVTAAPAAPAAPAAAGFPWLTISASVLATLTVAALVYAAVRALRRRRQTTVMIVPPVMRRPTPQRAIGPAPMPAQAWLDGKVDAR